MQTFTSVGAGVLMNADFTASGQDGGTAPGGTTPGATTPRATLPTDALRVRRGSVGIPINCVGAQCQGLLTLRPRAAVAAKKSKVYGKKRFTVPAGSSKKVRVKLTKAGRKALRGHKKLRVTATLRFTSGQTQSFALKLRKAK